MTITAKKILVVEDEPISLTVVSNYLTSAGFEIEQAENGLEAFEILDKHFKDIGVVVLDRIMPYMSGLELLRKMQLSDTLKNIPVLMLTGLTEKEDIIDAIQEGAFDYLTKPVEKNLLIDLVKRALAE